MIADQIPRFVFGRMHGTADVVRFDALFQIPGETNISLLRKRLTLDEIDVKHVVLPQPALLRQGFGLRRPKVGFCPLKVGGQPSLF